MLSFIMQSFLSSKSMFSKLIIFLLLASDTRSRIEEGMFDLTSSAFASLRLVLKVPSGILWQGGLSLAAIMN
jgi:hypothetical protein